MSETKSDPIYSVAPGVDAVPLRDGHLLFRSDTLAIRVEGGFARTLEQRLLPLLDGHRPFSDVCAQVPDLPADHLRDRFDALVRSQVLRRTELSVSTLDASGTPAAAATLTDSFDISAPDARARLARMQVAIAGLEAHGAHLASLLASCGVGSLVLLDPFPCEPGNLSLIPPDMTANAVGVAREDVVANALRRGSTTIRVETAGGQALTPARIDTLTSHCHLLIGCFDRAFVACHHWLNRASWTRRIPALYAESRGHTALIGPLVLPGQTACFMCYRMRSIACEDDFDAAMTYEEFLDRQHRPALARRPTLPTLPMYIASLLAHECFRLVLGQSPLAGTVLEFDAQTFATEMHPLIQVPNCPVCGGNESGARERRPHPLTGDVASVPPGDLASVMPRLCSRRTGVIRGLHVVQQDVTEPAVPYVLGAQLANHRFVSGDTSGMRMCSGKGFTEPAARISTCGEAVERYSAACWTPDEITYGRRDALPGPSLDPSSLVLYAADQYATGRVPYTPYTGDNALGWTPARSLVSGDWIYVPAQAVFLGYAVRSPDEFLCPITSNGLAAGSTILSAALAATCEVLERDAFMIAWMNRLAGTRADPATHPDRDVRELCAAYRRRCVELRLYKLPTDHPCHVFAALALQGQPVRDDTPAMVVGLGADLDAARAARQAVLEIGQVRPALRHRLRQPDTRRRLEALVADPHQVTTLEDHDLLYASPSTRSVFDFWLDVNPEPVDWRETASPSASVEARLERLADHFRAAGTHLIYCNVTPPDMASFGLHTVRAIVPGFQPIHFGWKEARLGGDRLYSLPLTLGLVSARRTAADLHDHPHPLA